MSEAGSSAEVARRRHDLSEAATKKIFRRLIPFLLLMYVIAFLDRSNVSFAQQEFQADFGISAAGIFNVIFRNTGRLCQQLVSVHVRQSRSQTFNIFSNRSFQIDFALFGK